MTPASQRRRICYNTRHETDRHQHRGLRDPAQGGADLRRQDGAFAPPHHRPVALVFFLRPTATVRQVPERDDDEVHLPRAPRVLRRLAIASTDYDWKKHVVIHLNWVKVDVSNLGEFEETLQVAVCDALSAAGYAYDEKIPPSANLGRAIDHFGSIRHDPENEPDKGEGAVLMRFNASALCVMG